MKWSIVCWALHFLLSTSMASTSCPAGMIQSSSNPNKCYLFNPLSAHFYKASGICNQNQGFLASVHDAFESTFIHDHLYPAFQNVTTDQFWIGATNYVNGNWSWIDGTPFDFVDWISLEPSGVTGHECGAAYINSGAWMTADCLVPKPFVCVYNLPEAPTTNLPPPHTTTSSPVVQCPNGWSYCNQTGYCYFVRDSYSNPSSWEDNESWCFSQGSHLASIHSKYENDFVMNLLTPYSTGVCNVYQYAWIGLYSVTNFSTWRWTDDSPYDYELWAAGHPNNADQHAYCGLSSPLICQGAWGNGICSDPFRFAICKKLPS